MTTLRWTICALIGFFAAAPEMGIAQQVELLDSVCVNGDARDHSRLKDLLVGDVPHDRLGGFSGIEHVGDGRYWILSDRGPGDGAANYACRIHEARISPLRDANTKFTFELLSTTLLRDEQNQNLTGFAMAIDRRRADRGLRFDPEGIRQSPDGVLWLSDEYGPSIVGFDEKGRRTRALKLPARYAIEHPSAEPGQEDTLNCSGRQENRGLEGLAISTDGKRLYGLMQGPLLQDGARNEKGERVGVNCRIVEIEIATGATRELVYPLEQGSLGLNEILTVNDHEFLVIERDSKEGAEATTKQIYKIDIQGAADVAAKDSLPQARLTDEVVVKKKLLIDLLDPRYGLSGDKFPQKVEGLTFGPTLPDGRRLLVVCTDNDFLAEKGSWLYFFALPGNSE